MKIMPNGTFHNDLHKTNQLINPTEQNASWEAESCSQSRNSLPFREPQEVHCCVHKKPLLSPILNQISPVHIFTPYFFKIHFSIKLPPLLHLPNALSSSLIKILYKFTWWITYILDLLSLFLKLAPESVSSRDSRMFSHERNNICFTDNHAANNSLMNRW